MNFKSSVRRSKKLAASSCNPNLLVLNLPVGSPKKAASNGGVSGVGSCLLISTISSPSLLKKSLAPDTTSCRVPASLTCFTNGSSNLDNPGDNTSISIVVLASTCLNKLASSSNKVLIEKPGLSNCPNLSEGISAIICFPKFLSRVSLSYI